VLILGYGVSGQSAELFISQRGGKVFIYDEKPIKPKLGCAVSDVLNEHFDLCVTSPGFSLDHPVLRSLKDRGVPVVGELELSFDASRWNYWIAVTGNQWKDYHHVLYWPSTEDSGVQRRSWWEYWCSRNLVSK